MARLLWLADVLRDAGLTVHLYDGWKTRGLESFGPVLGVICHGTAGSLTSTDAGETRTIAITGSNTATAPIAQLYQSRSGAWWVLASGTCTGVKTGTGGPLRGHGDDAVLQIEAQHHPSEPWTDVQYRSYVRGVAALVRQLGVGVEMVIGHGEHQPGEKSDPWFDMNNFRRQVAAVLNGDDDVSDAYHLLDNGKRPGFAPGDQTHSEPRYGSISNANVVARIDRAAFDAKYAADKTDAIEAGLVALAAKVGALQPGEQPIVTDEQLERVLRKVVGSVDGAPPTT